MPSPLATACLLAAIAFALAAAPLVVVSFFVGVGVLLEALIFIAAGLEKPDARR